MIQDILTYITLGSAGSYILYRIATFLYRLFFKKEEACSSCSCNSGLPVAGDKSGLSKNHRDHNLFINRFKV